VARKPLAAIIKPPPRNTLPRNPGAGRNAAIPPQPAVVHPPNTNKAVLPFQGIGKGKILIIVANGPSHKEVDTTRLAVHPKIDVMSINKPDDRIWPTTYWTFSDKTQYMRHEELWKQYRGPIFNTPSVGVYKDNCIKITNLVGKGFSGSLTAGLYLGRSTTYAGMQIALWMGYDHVYILGCDMAAVGGKLYPWGTNPDVDDKLRASRFAGEASFYEWAGEHLAQDTRSRYTFCTLYNPWPFVDRFNRLDHRGCEDIILQHADRLAAVSDS
jgi:hypothetical protein